MEQIKLVGVILFAPSIVVLIAIIVLWKNGVIFSKRKQIDTSKRDPAIENQMNDLIQGIKKDQSQIDALEKELAKFKVEEKRLDQAILELQRKQSKNGR